MSGLGTVQQNHGIPIPKQVLDVLPDSSFCARAPTKLRTLLQSDNVNWSQKSERDIYLIV